ncbi:hypothetical protein D3C81_358470 [compost metagenome]
MAPTRTDEDSSYVKMYILLPMILTAFERDKLVAKKSFKTPMPYVVLIESAIKRVEADLKETRRKLRILGIKVYEETRTEISIDARYLCRGYHHEFSMLWSFVKAESSVLMERYLGIDIYMYIDPNNPYGKDQYNLPTEIAKPTDHIG